MRKKRHAEHANHERWLVSYADFITLLFAFFTTLYAISTVDQKKAGKLMYSMRTAFDMQFFPSETGVTGYSPLANPPISPVDLLVTDGDLPGADEQKELEKQFSEVKSALMVLAERDDMKNVIDVHKDPRGLVVSLSEAHFFRSGVADLSSAGLTPLDHVIATLADKKLNLIVEGHTDDVPIRRGPFRTNWELSTGRATSVVAYFIDHHSIAPGRITAAGYAQYRPVGDNKTADGRRRNRRIDVVIVAPQPNKRSEMGVSPEPEASGPLGADPKAAAAPIPHASINSQTSR